MTAEAIATQTEGLPPATVEAVREAVKHSLAANTAIAYRRGWRSWESFCKQQRCKALPGEAAYVAGFLTWRASQGRSVATIRSDAAAIAAAHKAAGVANPCQDELVRATIRGLARKHAKPQRQATGLGLEDAARAVALATSPRQRPGGKWETIGAANRRGRIDAAIVSLLFQAGLRRSEAAALKWGDVEPVEGGCLVHVRTSKANQEGAETDVRFTKNGFAQAVLAIRPKDPDPDSLVLGGINGQTIGRRFAATCRAAGLEGDYTGHSGRVGLAQELTRRGASTTETQLAGGWKTARMVARYSAGVAAEQGAVAKYL